VRLLGSPALLAVRLELWVAVSWIAGLAALGAIFGVVAQTAAAGNVGVAGIRQSVSVLGGEDTGPATAWIGYEFLFLGALVAVVAAGQIAALRGEEADGHLDHLLARPVGRWSWAGGRLGLAVGLVVLTGLTTGIAGWAGMAVSGGDIGLGTMLRAGFNVMVPGLFVLGVGTLLFGLVPRVAVPALYALVLWSFLVAIVGTGITSNHWVLDTAVLSHLGPVPASSLDWTAILWLVGLGWAAALGGLAAFERRDLAAA
jgi:ABC-2 type transport system permease protein